MAKKVLSIVIGPECTKVCEVSYKKNYKNKGIRVYRSISFPTPANSIEDGYIKDPDLFGEELRKQLKTGKLKADKAIFAISSSKIANREIVLPPSKDKKIMEIIKTGASDYFPIDIKDYILSFTVLERKISDRKVRAFQKKYDKKENKLLKQQAKLEKKAKKKKSKTEIIVDKMEQMDFQSAMQPEVMKGNNVNFDKEIENKNHMRINVYAVPSTLVKNYYHFAKAMHLDIVSLDYIGNSSFQMIKRQVNRGTNVFVQLNEQDTMISILRDETLILQRTIGYGISMLIDAILEQDFYKVGNKEEALELLENCNLLSGEVPKEYSVDFFNDISEAAVSKELYATIESSKLILGQKENQARANIIDSLHFLSSSVVRMLDYYKSTHKNEEINKIHISGSGMRIKGIDQFFYAEIGMPHVKMERLWTVSAKKKAVLYRKNPGEFISCIGAVIKPVDFVPKEFIEKKQKRSAIFATVVFTLACIIGSVGTVYISYSDYQIAKQKLDEINGQYNAMQQVNGVFTDYDEAVKELGNLQEFENETRSNNDNINSVIKELENKLPSGTVINTMQFSESGISMSVVADDNNVGANALIAKVYQQLEAIEFFDTVDIGGIVVAEDEISSKVSFTINCTYPSDETGE